VAQFKHPEFGGSRRRQDNDGTSQQQAFSGPAGPVSLSVPPAAGGSGIWWPADFGGSRAR
jgi:hypothetical protein